MTLAPPEQHQTARPVIDNHDAPPAQELPLLSCQPHFRLPVNAVQAARLNDSTGPPGSLLSRTSAPPHAHGASSTQLPLEKLRLDFTQRPAASTQLPLEKL